MVFKKKSLVTQETLGERFLKVRLGANWDIARASRETRIAPHYIKALEQARYDDIPGEIYIKNFIKIYSKRLGLNPSEQIEKYLTERHIIKGKKFRRSLQEITPQSFLSSLLNPAPLKTAAICFAVGIMLSYIAVNVYKTVAPPPLFILHPKDNMVSTSLSLTVSGKSDPEAEVIINNEPVILNKEGMFEGIVHLKQGLNLIVILSKRKHGMERRVVRHILVGEDQKISYSLKNQYD
ncbi:MAG: helix-turn-helix domain-containing protein [Candidatus Jacksonbacteria bacterium]|nr:helix-turn-helix domain-containing protein [Candidatus Jacksonbacteria bacterium]